jgi:hypothetical protein
MGKRGLVCSLLSAGIVVIPAAAHACGGLVAADGAVNLSRTTTLAAYVDGVEHYITGFEFTGLGGNKFGSIVPLPGEPTSVKRAGDWTLQRLLQEVQGFGASGGFSVEAAVAPFADRATVVLEAKIDALDITVVKGGAAGVAQWALDEGFSLSPDSPEILEFYAKRSPYFMAASFDAKRAAKLGQGAGDSTPIHVTIPIEEPWVPLRILTLGRTPSEFIEADIFLLTPEAPAMLPVPRGAGNEAGLPVAGGLRVEVSQPATAQLLTDLASDKGMKWLPKSGMHFTYLQLAGESRKVGYDLALDPSGRGRPSWRAAGFPAGIGGIEQNPVAGPKIVRDVRTVEVPVAAVDRSGWIATTTILILVLAVMLLRTTLLNRR